MKPGWQANLELGFAHRDRRTVLAHRSHRGPLQVQKALYPEGPAICHVNVLHPPGGIAGGDSLQVDAVLGAQCRVCLTTPGASKWYRCPEGGAAQRLHFRVGDDALLEWLPRENIFFDASRIQMRLDVELASTATFFGWEILCFGRRASGEGWHTGSLGLHSTLRRDRRLLWSERAAIQAGGGFNASAVGLAGFTVSATFVAAAPRTPVELLAACRSVAPDGRDSRYGTTLLPGVLLARYLGHSSEDAFNWFISLWKLLRPALSQAAAIPPRLWAC